MSIKVMALIYEADLPRDEKTILQAYGDHADDDGRNIFPSIERIAWKTSYCERSVQRITRKLEERGVLVPDGKGPYGTNRYRIPLGALPKRPSYEEYRVTKLQGDKDDAGGDKTCSEGVQNRAEKMDEMSPNPSCEPSMEPSEEIPAAGAAENPPDIDAAFPCTRCGSAVYAEETACCSCGSPTDASPPPTPPHDPPPTPTLSPSECQRALYALRAFLDADEPDSYTAGCDDALRALGHDPDNLGNHYVETVEAEAEKLAAVVESPPPDAPQADADADREQFRARSWVAQNAGKGKAGDPRADELERALRRFGDDAPAYRILVNQFAERFYLSPPWEQGAKKVGYWLKTLSDLRAAAAGDWSAIDEAGKRMEKDRLTIAGPRSLINTTMAVVAERKKDGRKGKGTGSAPPTEAELAERQRFQAAIREKQAGRGARAADE